MLFLLRRSEPSTGQLSREAKAGNRFFSQGGGGVFPRKCWVSFFVLLKSRLRWVLHFLRNSRDGIFTSAGSDWQVFRSISGFDFPFTPFLPLPPPTPLGPCTVPSPPRRPLCCTATRNKGAVGRHSREFDANGKSAQSCSVCKKNADFISVGHAGVIMLALFLGVVKVRKRIRLFPFNPPLGG